MHSTNHSTTAWGWPPDTGQGLRRHEVGPERPTCNSQGCRPWDREPRRNKPCKGALNHSRFVEPGRPGSAFGRSMTRFLGLQPRLLQVSLSGSRDSKTSANCPRARHAATVVSCLERNAWGGGGEGGTPLSNSPFVRGENKSGPPFALYDRSARW